MPASVRLSVLALAILTTTPRLATAQQATQPPTVQQPAPPAAKPADVASPDAILKALYDVISGPAGQKRDWNRMRSLFVPGAHLIPTGRGPDGKARHRMLTVEDYINLSGPQLEANGFFEIEVSREWEQFGNVAHAFSTYESRRTASLDEKPFARGINSIQLFNDGTRWYVVNIFWDSEREGQTIPAKYLKK